MSHATPSDSERPQPRPIFATTRWSLVLAATQSDTAQAGDALAKLCQTYWFPLYAYVRRQGHSAPDAQDLTQGFFERLLERRWVADADRERGRFRTFLLTAMSRFLAGDWNKSRTQKRGGGAVHIPIELDTAEERYGHEPVERRTPEQDFDRRWALTLLDTALQRMRTDYDREGKGDLFAALYPCMVGDRDCPAYVGLAAKLGMNEGAVRVAVHRMRKAYRRLLREEIAQTITADGDVDDELHHLFAALAGS